jgi:acyl-CoA thioester hydrolase
MGEGSVDQDGGWVQTGLGVVHPWLCDAMGHLTTRHYLGVFDDASWHLFAHVGYDAATAGKEGWGWADVRHEISYETELRAGDLVVVQSRVTRLGGSSVDSQHRMLDRGSGQQSATLTARTVCFDLQVRRSRLLPDEFRRAASAIFGLASGAA